MRRRLDHSPGAAVPAGHGGVSPLAAALIRALPRSMARRDAQEALEPVHASRDDNPEPADNRE